MRQIIATTVITLVGVVCLGAATPAFSQQGLTKAQQEQIARDGATFGQGEHVRQETNQPTLTEGTGEKGAGQVTVDGRVIDVNKLTPNANQSKVDALNNLSESGSDLQTLRTTTEAKESELAEDRGPEGQAFRTAERSAVRAKEVDQQVKDDELFWQSTLPALQQGRDGLVQGEDPMQCETITTVETQPSNAYTEEEMTCDRVPDFSQTAMCTREYQDVTSTITYDQDQRALLNIDNGTSGEICRRERNVTSHQENLSQSRAGDLEITTETAGLSCRRYRWADAVVTNENRVKEGSLAINDEMGGMSCRRERWVDSVTTTTNGSRTASLGIDTQSGGLSCTRFINVVNTSTTQAQTMNGTLSVNNEVGGLSCTRERWVTGGTVLANKTQTWTYNWGNVGSSMGFDGPYLHVFEPQYAAIYNLRATKLSGCGPPPTVIDYTNASFMGPLAPDWPSGVSHWTPAMGAHVFGTAFFNFHATTCRNQSVTYQLDYQVSEVAKSWSLIENGNCADVGSPNCPTAWSCTGSAPTTINGHSVTAGEVSALAALFPGAQGACVSGQLSRTCSGSPSTNNSISIAHLIPGGATSISGFGFVTNNPQAGVTVNLTQTPSLANGWVANFTVVRTNWGITPANPAITLYWDAHLGGVSHSIVETGNCGDTGSPNCPALWSCTATAPATVNGQLVTVPIANERAPLFPGAGNTCASASLSRACSGSVAVSSNVSIADLIPAGTTAIQNFNWTVTNPQSGVAVSLLEAPTAGNGWVARFSVNRTNFGGVAQPSVTLTWQISGTTYNWSVVDTGGTVVMNWGSQDFWAAATASVAAMGQVSAAAMTTDCSDPGSTVCPTTWSCTRSAPTTINSIAVSAGMVSGLPALFGGAATTCVEGELRRICSGTSTLGTSIPIGDQIPAGVTSITNLAFTVLNPQAGVTVQMIVPPTYANGWSAGFEVRRTNYTYQPSPVQVRITFTVAETNIVLSTREDGNCSDPGSTACPTSWSCAASAPTTINGQAITLPMVQGEPLLYPGASNACIEGLLSRVCNGSSNISTQIPIGDLLPAGTTDITNFAWNVTNPQAQLAVTLVSAPSLANGWVATFSVVRNYSVPGTPVKPNIMMTWNVLGPVQYDHSVITEGDCSGAADGAVSPSCPVRWRCLTPLPANVNNIDLTTQMLEIGSGEELFPGEGRNCAEAIRERHCEGEGANLTVVDISAHLPAGTQTIQGYGWEIVVAGAGVAVTQVEPPTLANAWRATFRTTRTDWTVTPTQPDIRLFWQVQTTSTAPEVIETGDCDAEGDEMCTAAWRCVEEFDPGNVGGVVSSGEYVAQYNTATSGATYSWSIAGAVPAGVTTISNFQMEVLQRGSAAVITGITQTPSAANGWMVRIRDNGTCGGGGGGPGGPTDPGGSTEITSLFDKVLGGLVPTAIAQSLGPCGPNRLRFTWDNLSGGGAPPAVTPLFPGAPATCKRAERYLDCRNINDGEICHETEAGTVCEVVEGGPFDNCAELRENDMCTFQRTICNEDGWGGTPANPICRIETDVYKCRTPVEGEDIIVHDNKVCHGNLALCADGSCTQHLEEPQESTGSSMRKAAAHLVIRENMMTDYVHVGGGGGPGPGGPGGPVNPEAPVIITMLEKAGSTILGGVVADAKAQSAFDVWDTIKLVRGMGDAVESDPDGYAAAQGNYTMDSLRFFDGKSYDCMKALGGLLNCCTKKIDPKKTNEEWWKSFGDVLHERFSESVQCKLDALSPEQKESGSDFMSGGATFDDLSKGFTGLQDMLSGGGSAPSCGSPPRMEDVMKDFMGTMKNEVFPSLGWYCDTDEKELAAKKETGTCTYLGEYCRKRVLGFCIDRRQRHCCFNSPMTKMIREQLRDMGVKGMGTAKNPDCSGVSPAQFAQMNTTGMDTSDLEGRMMLGNMFPDMADILNNSNSLLEQFTGVGSSINSDRVNSHDRTNDQLDGTNPDEAVESIDGFLQGLVPDHPTAVTGTVPGEVTFVTGYRTIKHSPGLNEREVRIALKRYGNAGGVSVSVAAVGETAVAGTDFVYAPQAVSWGAEDSQDKYVTLVIRKAGRTAPVKLELRLGTPGGGATVGATGVMQIQIDPGNE